MCWDQKERVCLWGAGFTVLVQALPEYRDDVPCQTLWYRSPEVLFGRADWSCPIDVWSLGMVIAEICGYPFHKGTQETSRPTEVSYWVSVCSQLGRPTAHAVELWPKFPRKMAMEQSPRGWPHAVYELLDVEGVGLLDECLEYKAVDRVTMDSARLSELFT